MKLLCRRNLFEGMTERQSEVINVYWHSLKSVVSALISKQLAVLDSGELFIIE